MTITEVKTKYGVPDRHYYVNCVECPLYELDNECPCGCTGYEDAWQAIANYLNGGKPTPQEPIQEPIQEPTVDMVNRPPHYCREGGMECIDEMIILFGKEVVKHFCLCNSWKYRYRSNAKNGEEDLKKSDWYIKKYKELCEMGDTNE